MDILIRDVVDGDFENWLCLWKWYNESLKREISLEVTRAVWTKFLNVDEPLFAMAVELDDTLLGFAHFVLHSTTEAIGQICLVQDIFLMELVRDRGWDKNLMEAVYQKAISLGASEVYWYAKKTGKTESVWSATLAETPERILYRKVVADIDLEKTVSNVIHLKNLKM